MGILSWTYRAVKRAFGRPKDVSAQTSIQSSRFEDKERNARTPVLEIRTPSGKVEPIGRGPYSLHYISNVDNPAYCELALKELQASWSDRGLLVLLDTRAAREFAQKLPENITYAFVSAKRVIGGWDAVSYALAKRYRAAAKIRSNALAEFFAGEFKRVFAEVEAVETVAYAPCGTYLDYVVCSAPCSSKTIVVDYESLAPQKRNRVASIAAVTRATMRNWSREQVEPLSERARASVLDDQLQANLVLRYSSNTDYACVLKGVMAVHAPQDARASDLDILFANMISPTQSSVSSNSVFDSGIKVGFLGRSVKCGSRQLAPFKIVVSKSQASKLADNCMAVIAYTSDSRSNKAGSFSGTAPIQCNLVNLHQGERRRWRPLLDEVGNMALFFRHGPKNRLVFCLRQINPTDYLRGKLVVEAGYWLAKLKPCRNAIVLFEKNASRYEESASVVYEHLLDDGYTGAKFILDDAYPYKDCIPAQYRCNVVARGSLEHYRLFFGANTFIGTEMLPHCAELGSSSRRIGRRLKDPQINYIFLQHGVTYMLSLNSEARSFFGPRKTTTGKHRVVVGSQLEKEHFISKGGYSPDMLYVSGLPKFDRNEASPDADLIVIMPTWRPWEMPAARSDIMSTGYYRLLKRMVAAVPLDLRSKLVVLVHPLFQGMFQKQAQDVDPQISAHLDFMNRYDDILAHTRLLVTDYSSIAYDAFSRGANVVFFWQDLDECLGNYGPSAELMLDEALAFGAVCYDETALSQAVAADYEAPQAVEYRRRYQRIVEFDDGCNTERFMHMLKDDGII